MNIFLANVSEFCGCVEALFQPYQRGVEVEGRAEPGSVYARLAPGFTPFAFTNPIRVDAQGDGRWEPPGLQSPLPASIADPLAGD